MNTIPPGLHPPAFAADGSGLPGMPLLDPEVLPVPLFLLGLACAAIGFALLSLPSLAHAIRQTSWKARLGILLALVAGLIARHAMGPGWFLHDDFYESILLQRIRDAQIADVPLGRGWGILMQLLMWPHAPVADALFDVQLLVGLATIPLAGLVAWQVFQDEVAAVFTALLLALNPIHIRLSVSEDCDVPMLFLLLSATAALHLATRPSPAGVRGWQRAIPTFLVAHAGAALALMVHLRPDYLAYLPVPAVLALHGLEPALRLLERPVTWIALVVLAAAIGLVIPEVLHPQTNTLGLVTDAGSWWDALSLDAPFREPRRIVLLARPISPPLLLVLAAAGLARLVAAGRTARALSLLALASLYGFLFLDNNGFPHNVRLQFPGHVVFLLTGGYGAAGLVRLGGDSARRRGAFGAVLAGLVAISCPLSIGPLAVRASPALESEWLRATLPRLAVDRATTIVRMKAPRDSRNLNGSFPDVLASLLAEPPRLVSIRDFLATEPDDAALAGTLYYRGLGCRLSNRSDPPEPDGMRAACRDLERRYDLEPVADEDLPNVPYETMLRYPDPRTTPTLRIGFYRLKRRAAMDGQGSAGVSASAGVPGSAGAPGSAGVPGSAGAPGLSDGEPPDTRPGSPPDP